MESEKYLEGQSMQRPPLFESDGFIYWKNRFENYMKSKDLDLWHVITDGDFSPIQFNPKTKKDEIVSFHKQDDDLKKKLVKNNEAKMVIYNALPRKEYKRIFMCQTAKEIWDTLLITHQGKKEQSRSLALKVKKKVSDEDAQVPIVKTKSMHGVKEFYKISSRDRNICKTTTTEAIEKHSKEVEDDSFDKRSYGEDNGEDEVGKY
ncbi:hypothetical protein Tco_0004546 [Tanacetum coccineum]